MFRTRGRLNLVSAAPAALALSLLVAACGNSASPTTSASASAPVASTAVAPSAAPSVAPSVAPSPSVEPSVEPSVAASASAGSSAVAGVDPAVGLTIGAPYQLIDLPSAAKTQIEQQMATGLGAFGNTVKFGFRQVTGGTSIANILMVMAFPQGTLNDAGYAGAIGGMTTAMKAKVTTSMEGGIDVTSGTFQGGTMAAFHDGDHLLFVLSAQAQDALPIAKALIAANK